MDFVHPLYSIFWAGVLVNWLFSASMLYYLILVMYGCDVHRVPAKSPQKGSPNS